MDDFTEEAITRPDVLELTAKVDVQVDPELNRGDVGIEPARVSITTMGGAVLTEQVDLPTGTPSRPLSFADIERKFEGCLAHAGQPIPAAKAHRLVETIAQLDELEDVQTLIDLAT